VDLRPVGRIWTVPGFGALETREDAERVLAHIQGELARGVPLQGILAQYLPAHAKPLLIATRFDEWLDRKRKEVASGELSPTYLRELERYARPVGHIGKFWAERSIYEISAATIDDWATWLRGRPISSKTRRNVVGAFRAFLGWLRRRGEITEIPEMPEIRVDEHAPVILPLEVQDRILEAIPEARRGAFLAMARLGLRPGEVRALNVEEYRDGWVTVAHAMKGLSTRAPRGGTKGRNVRRVPVDAEIRAWIERDLSESPRLGGALFRNPKARNREKRWIQAALGEEWRRACDKVGVRVKLYEGTKHTFASEAAQRVPLKHVQDFLGHADIRSTERYAKLQSAALVHVLRPGRVRQACDKNPES
jgi:integrase